MRFLPGSCLCPPVRVVYEAGPTGFGLIKFLLAAGIDTMVAAPSKLQRPSGDRVKTDAKDAAGICSPPARMSAASCIRAGLDGKPLPPACPAAFRCPASN